MQSLHNPNAPRSIEYHLRRHAIYSGGAYYTVRVSYGLLDTALLETNDIHGILQFDTQEQALARINSHAEHNNWIPLILRAA